MNRKSYCREFIVVIMVFHNLGVHRTDFKAENIDSYEIWYISCLICIFLLQCIRYWKIGGHVIFYALDIYVGMVVVGIEIILKGTKFNDELIPCVLFR
jgi:hypothetical protein